MMGIGAHRTLRWIGTVVTIVPFILLSPVLHGQLILNQTQTPSTLVQNVLLGPGVFASNVTFLGQPGTSMPTGADEPDRIARFNAVNTNLGISGGIMLATGNVEAGLGPNDEEEVSSGGMPFNNTPDPDLNKLANPITWPISDNIYNLSKLEFDFIPLYDMVNFRYVFASEEYEHWACSQYNDVFGFFLSGPGINGPYSNNSILINFVPNSITPVGVNSVNSGLNGANANGPIMDPFYGCWQADSNWVNNTPYFVYNGSGSAVQNPYCCDEQYVQYNGFTVILEASAAVTCGEQYHIKLAVGNVADWRVPSAVFLEQGSFTSEDRFHLDVRPGINVEMTANDTIFIESECDSVYLQFHRNGGTYLDEDLEILISGGSTTGVDHLPVLPTQIHFDLLDTMVVVPIAVPVDEDGVEDLVITIMTCNGLKLQTYIYTIDQRPPLIVELDDIQADCPGSFTLQPTVTGGSGDPNGLVYLWNTGETTPSITVEVEQTTQFHVTVTDSCWTLPVTDSAWVFIPEFVPLVLDVTPDTAVACQGTAVVGVEVAGGVLPYQYEWSANGGVVGTTPEITVPASLGTEYSVEVTDACGQVQTGSLTVTTGPTPPIQIIAIGDTVLCPQMPMLLQVLSVSGGGGAYDHSWSPIAPGTTPGNTSSLEVAVADDSYFTITITDECGNTADTTVAAIILDHDPFMITTHGDTIVCPGEPVVLSVVVEGGAGEHSINWQGVGEGAEVTWIAQYPGMEAVVQVTDECGAELSGSVLVEVFEASAEIDATQITEQSWEFIARTEPLTGNDIEWDLGDGTSSNSVAVTHTYQDLDSHWVYLFVVTPDGCTAVDSVLTPAPAATFYFPNSFTPNGDGINESFGVSGSLLDDYRLLIFDRWGQVIFESTELTHQWNGLFASGEEVMDGIYQYKYMVSGKGLMRREGFGHVTLLR